MRRDTPRRSKPQSLLALPLRSPAAEGARWTKPAKARLNLTTELPGRFMPCQSTCMHTRSDACQPGAPLVGALAGRDSVRAGSAPRGDSTNAPTPQKKHKPTHELTHISARAHPRRGLRGPAVRLAALATEARQRRLQLRPVSLSPRQRRANAAGRRRTQRRHSNPAWRLRRRAATTNTLFPPTWGAQNYSSGPL